MTPFISPAAITEGRRRVAAISRRAAASSPLLIVTNSLPSGQVGADYAVQIAAEGGVAPYAFSVSSGELPTGLSLSETGLITGTPTSEGESDLTITVADNAGAEASAELSITIVARAENSAGARRQGMDRQAKGTGIVAACQRLSAAMQREDYAERQPSGAQVQKGKPAGTGLLQACRQIAAKEMQAAH